MCLYIVYVAKERRNKILKASWNKKKRNFFSKETERRLWWCGCFIQTTKIWKWKLNRFKTTFQSNWLHTRGRGKENEKLQPFCLRKQIKSEIQWSQTTTKIRNLGCSVETVWLFYASSICFYISLQTQKKFLRKCNPFFYNHRYFKKENFFESGD